jgi:DNA-binding NarL/FixJ family response regulator
MRSALRLLVVMDNSLVREGLAVQLTTQPSMGLVVFVATTAAALTHVHADKPAIALVDADLSQGARHLVAEISRSSGTRVVVMNLLPGDREVIAFIRAGASGFVVRGATFDDVLSTVRAVAGGSQVMPASMTAPPRRTSATGHVVR